MVPVGTTNGIIRARMFWRHCPTCVLEPSPSTLKRTRFQCIATARLLRLDNFGAEKHSLLTLHSPRGRPLRARQSMPLDRVPGASFEVLVDHTDGQRGRSCPRGPPFRRASSTTRAWLHNGRDTMGAYCLLGLIA